MSANDPSGEQRSGAGASGGVAVHATCLSLAGAGVLIRGPSGSGKSDLALRCLALGRLPEAFAARSPWPGARDVVQLVADDYVLASPVKYRTDATALAGLEVSAPDATAGLIEVRHVGLVKSSHVDRCAARLVINLVADAPERLPPSPLATVDICGVALPSAALRGFEASAPIKVLLLLDQVMAATA